MVQGSDGDASQVRCFRHFNGEETYPGFTDRLYLNAGLGTWWLKTAEESGGTALQRLPAL